MVTNRSGIKNHQNAKNPYRKFGDFKTPATFMDVIVTDTLIDHGFTVVLI
jgi:hypothetical protein